jgi:preprotein translocase subunit SecD
MLYFSRWKTAAILGTTLIVCLPALTNVLPAATFDGLPGWAQRKIELGMDLRGGTHVELVVDTKDIRQQLVQRLRDDLRNILREERIGYTGLTIRDDTVEVRVRDVWDMPQAMRRIDEFADPKFHAMRPMFLGAENVTLSPNAPGWIAGPGDLSPVPRVDVAIEGQLFRLKATEFAFGERIAASRSQAIGVIGRRLASVLGTKFGIRVRPVGTDRIVVDSVVPIPFERWFYLS